MHASPEVTLEEDLARRDLTINAIAKAVNTKTKDGHGQLIDPFNGKADIKSKTLRHVSDALRKTLYVFCVPRVLPHALPISL